MKKAKQIRRRLTNEFKQDAMKMIERLNYLGIKVFWKKEWRDYKIIEKSNWPLFPREYKGPMTLSKNVEEAALQICEAL